MFLRKLFLLDGRVPLQIAMPFGFQHVLAMFLSNMAPISIIAMSAGLDTYMKATLLQNCMFVAAIATIIQLYPLWRVGARLPIVMGTSFTFVAILCSICAKHGISAALGAVLIGGLFEGTLGLVMRKWDKIISPIVSASVVTCIGFSLFPVGISSFCGGFGAADFCSPKNLLLGIVSLVVCLLWGFFAKGVYRLMGVLVGMGVGYLLAISIGKVEWANFLANGVVSLPKLLPIPMEFNLSAILSICIIFLVSATETIGDTSALVQSVLKRPVTDREYSGAIACDGYASSLASLFGCSPVTSFSQNVGLICMTKIINRFTVLTGICCLLLASMFPPIGVFLSTVPNAVLGGCTIMMFGSIAVAGIQMIARCGFSQRNVAITSISLVCAFGLTTPAMEPFWKNFPPMVAQCFAENQVAVVFITAIILNLILPKKDVDTKKHRI